MRGQNPEALHGVTGRLVDRVALDHRTAPVFGPALAGHLPGVCCFKDLFAEDPSAVRLEDRSSKRHAGAARRDGCALVGLELVPVVALDQVQTPQLVLEFGEVG